MPTANAAAIPTKSSRYETGSSLAAKAMAGLLRRGEVVQTAAGEHLRIRLGIEPMWPGGARLAAERMIHLRQRAAIAQAAIEPTIVIDPAFASLVAALPDRVLCLDLETCGFSGSAMFLVGLLRHIEGEPTVELLVARNYAEEQAILETLWQTAALHEVLVTFNGKSFDWPMVLDRSTRYRLAAGRSTGQLQHVDLLHHARRRWRDRLPDCRLQTLEQLVCRRRRAADIPGHRIPAAYAEFVRTGFEREMDAILYHNALDLVTLFDLMLRLAG
jgi:uncharacterized protein YprB with RNaseH-like and TPR domain